MLAAGGVADGRGLAAALMLGASGVLIGTRFWASPEALGSDTIKRRLVEAGGDETLRTRVFDIVRDLDWPEGYSGRALANEFSRTWHGRDADLTREADAVSERYWTAVRAGDLTQTVMFAGEGVDLIHAVMPAGDIVREIAGDAEALLNRRARASSGR